MEVKMIIDNCISHFEGEERKITKTMKEKKKGKTDEQYYYTCWKNVFFKNTRYRKVSSQLYLNLLPFQYYHYCNSFILCAFDY